eukprot:CAMPEP_0181438442 /NCGR_PEP_ID=MMETSP1110-20121109/21910_1 /TAXON_ID=174948 /ORGANISM="Symbiodinium sp., Strain CCMP421" /LENGTH=344 /DNA_ID=CAMNT_0023562127 /DNA_START=61 /DNA_END=1095 /DNA_ORIENTATION=+
MAAVAKNPAKTRRSVTFADDSSPLSRNCSEKEQLMMQTHAAVARASRQRNSEIIGPFAAECQKRLDSLGGWESHGIQLKPEASEEIQVDRFLLADSRSQFLVTVLDGVLPAEMCQSFIDIHEQVGFATPPSALLYMAEQSKSQMQEYEEAHEAGPAHEDDDGGVLRQLVYEQGKNTSELVHIESPEFADYLWERVQHHLPNQQWYAGNFTSGVYEKCGIIPTFRFMRYQKGQGFKPHRDPSRIYAEDPLRSSSQGEPGIYKSFFTIAIYLNDSADFQGGELNFVKLEVDSAGRTYHQSQATVSPAVGRCALFSHFELHEGGGVHSGTKYMCQCDVLYKRVAALP